MNTTGTLSKPNDKDSFTTSEYYYFATPFLRNKRVIGRILAFFHILFFHKENKNKKKFFFNLFQLLLTGKSSNLNYWYKDYLLLKLPDRSSEKVFKEVFQQKIYDLPIFKSNPVIVDIGSHIGLSVLFFYQKFPRAKIYGYEPNPFLFKVLLENVNHNLNQKNVYLFNKAITSSDRKTRLFYLDRLHSSRGSFYKKNFQELKNRLKIRVSTVKFSKIITVLKNINILKIDTEGTEYELLPSLVKYSDRIEFLIMEVHKYPGADCFDLLNKLKKKYDLLISAEVSFQNIKFFLRNHCSRANPILVYGVNRNYNK